MLETVFADRGLDTSTVLAILIPLVLYYLYGAFRRKDEFDVPKYTTTSQKADNSQNGDSKFDSLDDIMQENYAKDKNHIYKVEHPHKDVVIIPTKYVDDLTSKPDEEVNFLEDINDRFLGEYTKMLAPGGIKDETLTHTIKNTLNNQLGNIMGDLQEEITYAFSQEVGECKDWTPLYPMMTVMRIIALVSGRIFAGPELNRNEEYLATTLGFAVEAFNVIPAMRPYPKWLRPLAQYWVKECRRPEASIDTMKRLLEPVLEGRKKLEQKPLDFVTWITENCPPGRKNDLTWQAMYQLQIATAAMHTTSNTMTHIWFDLAAHPEYLDPLREEIIEVQRTEPGGILSKTSMARLKKLDSFMKESQRCNPFSSTGFSRKILKPTTLHDGVVFPAGITVTVPVSCVAMDPTIYPDPETFDGFRFSKLRQQKGAETKHQYVTTSKDALNWGHGSHACPGRFFASNEIKIIMCHLLLNYDLKLEDGKGRPKNIWTEGGMIPDIKGKVLLRQR